MNSVWSAAVATAQERYAGLHNGAEEEGRDPAALAAERALSLVSGGYARIAEAGVAMLAAVFAALGRKNLNLTAESITCLRQLCAAGVPSDDAADDAWAEVKSGITRKKDIGDFIFDGDRDKAGVHILTCALYVASQITDMTAPQAQPRQSDAVANGTGSKELVRIASTAVLNPGTDPKTAARHLLALAPRQRALVIAGSFGDAMSALSDKEAKNASDIAERHGRRLEAVIDELGQAAGNTVEALVEAGDIEAVLAAIRGRAGEVSTVAQHLTAELIIELFATDPDVHDEDARNERTINIAWTLVMEAGELPAVSEFFGNTSEGRAAAATIHTLAAAGDEDAQQIMGRLAEVMPSRNREEEEGEEESDESAEAHATGG